MRASFGKSAEYHILLPTVAAAEAKTGLSGIVLEVETWATAGASTIKPMDVEKTIAEIELLEYLHSLPDRRPLQMADWKAANQKHDEIYANNPWFRLWKRYGE